MSTLTLTSEEAMAIWHEESTRFEQVDQVFIDTWRWGNLYNLIVRDIANDKFYSAPIRIQAEPHYYVNWEDFDEVEFLEVEKVAVTTYKWQTVKNAD